MFLLEEGKGEVGKRRASTSSRASVSSASRASVTSEGRRRLEAMRNPTKSAANRVCSFFQRRLFQPSQKNVEYPVGSFLNQDSSRFKREFTSHIKPYQVVMVVVLRNLAVLSSCLVLGFFDSFLFQRRDRRKEKKKAEEKNLCTPSQ